jgi:hypothetical protein
MGGGGMMSGGGMGGGAHGDGGMMGGGGMGRGGSFGGPGIAAMPSRGGAGPMMMRGENIGPMTHGGPITAAPMAGQDGRTASGFHDRFHDHFHHRFHNRNFFAFGFGGPIYDYSYDSCWAQVPTRFGWRWVNVCGDYGYY